MKKYIGKVRTYREDEAVAALEELARRWPETLWLFAASGSLNVMKKNDNGDRAVESGGVPLPPGATGGSYDQAFCIATIDIENDGGDW